MTYKFRINKIDYNNTNKSVIIIQKMNVTSTLLTTNKRDTYLFRARAIYNSLSFKPQVILTITDSTHGVNKSFRIQVHLSTNHETELAYFNISGNYVKAPFEQLARLKDRVHFAPPHMNIDCSDYQGQGVSKMLILIAFHYAKQRYPRFNEGTELFIDTDASTTVGKDASGNRVSYWTAIGMKDNEVCPSNAVSTGYEMRCFIKDLHPYLFR